MPIVAGMLYTRVRWEERALLEESRRRGDVRLVPINLEKVYFDLGKGVPSEVDIYLQRSVSYFKGLFSTAILEGMGERVVNSFDTSLVCGNKLLTTLRLLEYRVPTPRTIVSFGVETALEATEALGYPSILKPLYGSWGRLVAPLKDPQSTKAILESRTLLHPINQVYYLQEFVNRPPRDIRSFVVGEEVPTAIYRVSGEEEWRTNTSLGGKAAPCKITEEIRELSLRAAEAVGGGVLGVDLMEDRDRGLLVHEVNHVVEFRNTVRVTGTNLPGLILDYLVEVARR